MPGAAGESSCTSGSGRSNRRPTRAIAAAEMAASAPTEDEYLPDAEPLFDDSEPVFDGIDF